MAAAGNRLDYFIAVQMNENKALKDLLETLKAIQELSKGGAEFRVGVNPQSLDSLSRQVADSVEDGVNRGKSGRRKDSVDTIAKDASSISKAVADLTAVVGSLASMMGRGGSTGGGGSPAGRVAPSRAAQSAGNRAAWEDIYEKATSGNERTQAEVAKRVQRLVKDGKVVWKELSDAMGAFEAAVQSGNQTEIARLQEEAKRLLSPEALAKLARQRLSRIKTRVEAAVAQSVGGDVDVAVTGAGTRITVDVAAMQQAFDGFVKRLEAVMQTAGPRRVAKDMDVDKAYRVTEQQHARAKEAVIGDTYADLAAKRDRWLKAAETYRGRRDGATIAQQRQYEARASMFEQQARRVEADMAALDDTQRNMGRTLSGSGRARDLVAQAEAKGPESIEAFTLRKMGMTLNAYNDAARAQMITLAEQGIQAVPNALGMGLSRASQTQLRPMMRELDALRGANVGYRAAMNDESIDPSGRARAEEEYRKNEEAILQKERELRARSLADANRIARQGVAAYRNQLVNEGNEGQARVIDRQLSSIESALDRNPNLQREALLIPQAVGEYVTKVFREYTVALEQLSKSGAPVDPSLLARIQANPLLEAIIQPLDVGAEGFRLPEEAVKNTQRRFREFSGGTLVGRYAQNEGAVPLPNVNPVLAMDVGEGSLESKASQISRFIDGGGAFAIQTQERADQVTRRIANLEELVRQAEKAGRKFEVDKYEDERQDLLKEMEYGGRYYVPGGVNSRNVVGGRLLSNDERSGIFQGRKVSSAVRAMPFDFAGVLEREVQEADSLAGAMRNAERQLSALQEGFKNLAKNDLNPIIQQFNELAKAFGPMVQALKLMSGDGKGLARGAISAATAQQRERNIQQEKTLGASERAAQAELRRIRRDADVAARRAREGVADLDFGDPTTIQPLSGAGQVPEAMASVQRLFKKLQTSQNAQRDNAVAAQALALAGMDGSAQALAGRRATAQYIGLTGQMAQQILSVNAVKPEAFRPEVVSAASAYVDEQGRMNPVRQQVTTALKLREQEAALARQSALIGDAREAALRAGGEARAAERRVDNFRTLSATYTDDQQQLMRLEGAMSRTQRVADEMKRARDTGTIPGLARLDRQINDLMTGANLSAAEQEDYKPDMERVRALQARRERLVAQAADPKAQEEADKKLAAAQEAAEKARIAFFSFRKNKFQQTEDQIRQVMGLTANEVITPEARAAFAESLRASADAKRDEVASLFGTRDRGTQRALFNDGKAQKEAIDQELAQVRQRATLLERAISVATGGREIRSAQDLLEVQKSINASLRERADTLVRAAGAQMRELTNMRATRGFLNEFVDKTRSIMQYTMAGGLVYGIANTVRQQISQFTAIEAELKRLQGIFEDKSASSAGMVGQGIFAAASEYGVGVQQSLEASRIFAQTGASPAQTVEKTRASLAAQVGAGLDANQANEFLIAVENISSGRVGSFEILDRISRIESQYAVSARDLSEAIQKAGSLAQQLQPQQLGGVDAFDTVIGAATAIIESTRVSGNQAATALRFLISRLTAPEVGRSLQERFQINLAGSNPNELRPLQDILADIAERYNELTASGNTVQAQELLVAFAGARQTNTAAALLTNFNKAMEVANQSAFAYGDTQQRVALQLDTVSARFNQFQTALTNFTFSLLNGSGIGALVKGGLQLGTSALNTASGPTGLAALGLGAAAVGIGARGFGRSRMPASMSNMSALEIMQFGQMGGAAAEAGVASTGRAMGLLAKAGSTLAFIGTGALILAGIEAIGRVFKQFQEVSDMKNQNVFGGTDPNRFNFDEFRNSPLYQQFASRAGNFGFGAEELQNLVQAAADRVVKSIQTEGNYGENPFALLPGDKPQPGLFAEATKRLVAEFDRIIPGFRSIGTESERAAEALSILKDSAKFTLAIPQASVTEFTKDLGNLSNQIQDNLAGFGSKVRAAGVVGDVGFKDGTRYDDSPSSGPQIARKIADALSSAISVRGRLPFTSDSIVNGSGLRFAGKSLSQIIGNANGGDALTALDTYARNNLVVDSTNERALRAAESSLRVKGKVITEESRYAEAVSQLSRATDAQKTELAKANIRLSNFDALARQFESGIQQYLDPNLARQAAIRADLGDAEASKTPGEVFAGLVRKAFEQARQNVLRQYTDDANKAAQNQSQIVLLRGLQTPLSRPETVANLYDRLKAGPMVRERLLEPFINYAVRSREIQTQDDLRKTLGIDFNRVQEQAQAAQQFVTDTALVPTRILGDLGRAQVQYLLSGNTATPEGAAEIAKVLNLDTEEGQAIYGMTSATLMSQADKLTGNQDVRRNALRRISDLRGQYRVAVEQGVGGFLDVASQSRDESVRTQAASLKETLTTLLDGIDALKPDDVKKLTELRGGVSEVLKLVTELARQPIEEFQKLQRDLAAIQQRASDRRSNIGTAFSSSQAQLQTELARRQMNNDLSGALGLQRALVDLDRQRRIEEADSALRQAQDTFNTTPETEASRLALATAKQERERAVREADAQAKVQEYTLLEQSAIEMDRQRRQEALQLSNDMIVAPLRSFLQSYKNFSEAGVQSLIEGMAQAAQGRIVDIFLSRVFGEFGLLGQTITNAFDTSALTTKTAIEQGFRNSIAELLTALKTALPNSTALMPTSAVDAGVATAASSVSSTAQALVALPIGATAAALGQERQRDARFSLMPESADPTLPKGGGGLSYTRNVVYPALSLVDPPSVKPPKPGVQPDGSVVASDGSIIPAEFLKRYREINADRTLTFRQRQDALTALEEAYNNARETYLRRVDQNNLSQARPLDSFTVTATPATPASEPPGPDTSVLGALEAARQQQDAAAASTGKVGLFNKNFQFKGRFGDLMNAGLPLAGSLLGPVLANKFGKENNYGQEFSSIGSLLGTAAFGPVGGLLGGLAGGLLGGLFGKKSDDKQDPTEVLQKIERNTREQVQAFENQTRLLQLDSRFLNIPSTFTVPAYRPAGAGQVVMNNSMSFTITTSGAVDAESIATQVSTAISRQLQGLGNSFDVRTM